MKIFRTITLLISLALPALALAGPAAHLPGCCDGSCCPDCPFCPSGLHR
jgi:hypothetical protein